MKYTAAGPVLDAFHRSRAFVKGVRGPVGSAKSSACVAEMLRLAASQPADPFGSRKTRWACIRNTYPELKSTTLKTFHDWVPEEMCRKWDDAPITRIFRCRLPDGTMIHAEFMFISCDRLGDIGKFKSLELSGAWLNEASELSKGVLDIITSRVTRFPAKRNGGPRWPVVLMDTNSMDDEHWWYKLDVERDGKMLEAIEAALREVGIDRPLIDLHTQPPALLEASGSFVPNPTAENTQNLTLGAGYYLQMVAGKDQEWINLYLLNKYGRIVDGKPVYADEWKEHFHGKTRDLRPLEGLSIGIGMDFGLSPAAVPAQITPSGQMLCLGEIVAEERSMGIERFIRHALKPWLSNRFGSRWRYYVVGDPSGVRRADSDESYCFQILEDEKFETRPALTNRFYPRRGALAQFMNSHVGGEPALLLDHSCRLLKAGLAGRYHYRRVQIAAAEEPRFQNEPYKNKYSHVCEAAQYIALEFVGFPEEPEAEEQDQPLFMKKLLVGNDLPPWRRTYH